MSRFSLEGQPQSVGHQARRDYSPAPKWMDAVDKRTLESSLQSLMDAFNDLEYVLKHQIGEDKYDIRTGLFSRSASEFRLYHHLQRVRIPGRELFGQIQPEIYVLSPSSSEIMRTQVRFINGYFDVSERYCRRDHSDERTDKVRAVGSPQEKSQNRDGRQSVLFQQTPPQIGILNRSLVNLSNPLKIPTSPLFLNPLKTISQPQKRGRRSILKELSKDGTQNLRSGYVAYPGT